MRGGQLVFHYIKMTFQVVRKNLFTFFLLGLLLFVATAYVISSEKSVHYGSLYLLALVKTEYLHGGEDTTNLISINGRSVRTSWQRIYTSHAFAKQYKVLKINLLISAVLAFFICIILVTLWFWYLMRRGRSESQDNFIRGAKLGTAKQYKLAIRSDEKRTGFKSRLSIASLPLPPKSHRTNIALIGSPGVGKSATFLDLQRQYRRRGDKCFVLDPSGEFTRKFYREGTDKILSPGDARSVVWDVWSEGASPESYYVTSQSLIADSKVDNFFVPASRLVFEAVCQLIERQARDKNEIPSLKTLSHFILRLDDESLIDMVRKSDASSVLNKGSEKTTASIRATLSTFLQPLSRLREVGERFSFNDWLNDGTDSWVFVPITARQRNYCRPIITLWMEHFTMAVLGLEVRTDEDQGIHLLCDELPGYNKVPSLPVFLAEGRKYGGDGVLGFQNKAQLERVYGTQGADELEGLIGTFGIFRMSSNKDAEWASKLLLASDIEKSQEQLSFGAHKMRDSVSVNKSIRENQRLVTASEIVNLPDLVFYMRFGRGYPILRVAQRYLKLPDIAEPMCPLEEEGSDTFDALAEPSFSVAESALVEPDCDVPEEPLEDYLKSKSHNDMSNDSACSSSVSIRRF
jgi:type IV conjugative transfer system coupling protein TraD